MTTTLPTISTSLWPNSDETPVVVIQTPGKPLEYRINTPTLVATRTELFDNMRRVLGDPKTTGNTFAFGPELGQYGNMSLPEALEMCKTIGARVAQPSGKHIDLARAATDKGYCDWVKAIFACFEIPLTTVSIHIDTYAALAITDNTKIDAFCDGGNAEGPEQTQKRLLSRLELMLIGAANLGIPALHLFWGAPENLPVYGWQPTNGDHVLAMRKHFASLVQKLLQLAKELSIYLCHEIHFGTIAMTADDLIAVWEILGRPKEFAVGMDPSHFWHGETYITALDKLRNAGMEVILAHAKNFMVHHGSGRPLLGHQMDDRLRNMHFTSLEESVGEVAFGPYLGLVLMGGMGQFWIEKNGVVVPIYAEAEDPHVAIQVCTENGVKFLNNRFGNWRRPAGHFTDQMKK